MTETEEAKAMGVVEELVSGGEGVKEVVIDEDGVVKEFEVERAMKGSVDRYEVDVELVRERYPEIKMGEKAEAELRLILGLVVEGKSVMDMRRMDRRMFAVMGLLKRYEPLISDLMALRGFDTRNMADSVMHKGMKKLARLVEGVGKAKDLAIIMDKVKSAQRDGGVQVQNNTLILGNANPGEDMKQIRADLASMFARNKGLLASVKEIREAKEEGGVG